MSILKRPIYIDIRFILTMRNVNKEKIEKEIKKTKRFILTMRNVNL